MSFFRQNASHSNGFTLVELAIALTVIGLLIGGILKGQELIENAKITRTIKNLKDFDAAVTIFYDKYDELPGHLTRPSILPNCASGTRCGGTGASQEIYARFWIQLNRAGLITDIHEDAHNLCAGPTVPTGNFGRYFANVYYTNAAPYWMWVPDIKTSASGECEHRYTRVKTAYAIDTKIDDGKPRTGIFQGSSSGSCATSPSSNEYATEQTSDWACIGSYHIQSMD